MFNRDTGPQSCKMTKKVKKWTKSHSLISLRSERSLKAPGSMLRRTLLFRILAFVDWNATKEQKKKTDYCVRSHSLLELFLKMFDYSFEFGLYLRVLSKSDLYQVSQHGFSRLHLSLIKKSRFCEIINQCITPSNL